MKRVSLTSSSLLFVLVAVACGPSATTTTPAHTEPAPAPVAIATPAAEPLATTIDEARTLRQSGQLDAYERSLRQLAGAADAHVSRRATALLGLLLFDQKRDGEAIPTLERAAVAYPEVAPYLRLRVVEAMERSKSGNPAAVAQQIIATAPQSAAATIARLRLPALYAVAGDAATTDAAFAQLNAVPIDELTERDFTDLATRLARANRQDLATRLRMRLLNDYTTGRYTEQTYGHLTALADSPIDMLSLDQATTLASKLARADRYDQALDLLQRINRRFPDSAANDTYRAVRIRALFNSRNYTQLLAETENVELKDPALMLLRARAAWRDDRPQDFLTGLAALEKAFPTSKEAADAKVQRAKYYITDDKNFERAVANYSAAIDAGAVGSDGENIWNLGWTHFLAGKHDDALRTFDRYIRAYPDGDWKTNSLFWSAKIHEREDRIPHRDAALLQIVHEYPYSYYAYRAREIMKMPTVAPSAVENGNVFPNLAAELARVTDGRLAAVRELMSIDLVADATREMKIVAAAYPDNLGIQFMLADVYVQGGEPFRANTLLQRRFRPFVRHGGMNVPQRFWEILFPLAYREPIHAEAERRKLDPYLVASIIRQESGFEPTVVSNAGAVGLMQIMPQEAARIASIGGIEGITREALFDPYKNIAVGAAEFRQKLDRMQGNLVLAIAAYNAGEQPVGNWIARTPVDDIDLFVESIPYAETRLYVKSVTRNRFEYRRIYERAEQQQQQPSP